MKKLKVVIIIILMLCFTACSSAQNLLDMASFALERYEENETAMESNPLAGMDKNEKVLYILHESYPGHTFTAVTPAENFTDCGIYADENGLEFEVDSIYSLASYQIGMYDDYMYETLMAQDVLKKVQTILDKYGYEMDFSEENRHLSFTINITDYAATPEDILTVVKEINALDIYVPTYNFIGDSTGFSTGEINFYTLSEMSNIYIDLHLEQHIRSVSDAILRIPFGNNMTYTDDELLSYITSCYYVTTKYSNLNIIYRRDAYTNWENEHEGTEIYNGQYLVRKRYMTYDTPENFTISPFDNIDSGITYYNSQYSPSYIDDRVNGLKNDIEVGIAYYEYNVFDEEEFLLDLKQDIAEQIGNRTDVELVSVEKYPNEKHVIYKVEIKEPFESLSKQYYVMGDGMFVVVEQTTFTHEEYHDGITNEILESFEWEDIPFYPTAED